MAILLSEYASPSHYNDPNERSEYQYVLIRISNTEDYVMMALHTVTMRKFLRRTVAAAVESRVVM